MLNLLLPLYSFGMGTILIIIFALVCIGLVLIVLNIMNNDKTKEEAQKELEESKEENQNFR